MERFEVILWDIDGTLLRAGGVGRAATRVALEKVFGTVGMLEAHRFSGKTDWFTLLELMGPMGFSEAEIAAQVPTYATTLAREMQHMIGDFEVNALPGAIEAVTALQGTMLQGIVTGNVRGNVRVKLGAAGFEPRWFPFGAYGDESADRNDLPQMAIERAGLLAGREINPGRVLVVGDTVRDVEAARAVGAAVCIVETGFAEPEALRAAGPDWLLPDLTEFMEAVVGI